MTPSCPAVLSSIAASATEEAPLERRRILPVAASFAEVALATEAESHRASWRKRVNHPRGKNQDLTRGGDAIRDNGRESCRYFDETLFLNIQHVQIPSAPQSVPGLNPIRRETFSRD